MAENHYILSVSPTPSLKGRLDTWKSFILSIVEQEARMFLRDLLSHLSPCSLLLLCFAVCYMLEEWVEWTKIENVEMNVVEDECKKLGIKLV